MVAAEMVVVGNHCSDSWAEVPGVVEVGSRYAGSWAVLAAGVEERRYLFGEPATAAGGE